MASVASHLKFMVRSLESILWVTLDAVVIALGKRGKVQGRVLIIRTDGIGDFVLWSDAGRELYSWYRQQGFVVILLANVLWAEWASELGLADEVWGIDRHQFVRSLRYRWGWLRRLRQGGFAKVVHPVHSRVFLVGDTLVRATKAPERLAPEGDCCNSTVWQKRWSDRWYSRLIPEISPCAMELLRNAEFIRGLGLSNFIARAPTLVPSRVPSQINGELSAPYAVLFLGGGWKWKVWQAEKFCEIGRRLRDHGVNVVLGGGQSDLKLATKVCDSLNGNAINCVGKTSLSDLAELLRNAIVVVSSDTSAVHIAAAVGTSVVCILGGGDCGRFLPYVVEKEETSRPMPISVVQPMSCFGCKWSCTHPHKRGEPFKCISDISVEQVWCKLEALVSSRLKLSAHR